MIANMLQHTEIAAAKCACDLWTPQEHLGDIMQVVYRDWNGNIMSATLTEHQRIEGRAICSREADWNTGDWGQWRWDS